MLIYYVFFSLVILLGYGYQHFKIRWIKNKKRLFGILIFFPLFLIMGCRYDVGADYLNYLSISKMVANGNFYELSHIDYGYLLFNKISVMIFKSPFSVFFVTALVIVGLNMLIIMEQSKNVAVSLIIYLCFGFYFNAMNEQRQFLAITILFYALRFVREKKKVPFVILCITAISIHQSALVVLPVLVAAYVLRKKSFYKITLMVMVISRIGIDILIKLLKSNSIISYGSKYVEKVITEERLSLPNIIILGGVLLGCFFFRSYFKMNNDCEIYVEYTWIAFWLFVLFTPLGAATTRVAFYFTPAIVLLIPEIAYLLHHKGVYFFLIGTVLLLIGYIYLYSMLNNSVYTGNDFIPYKSIVSIKY